MDGSICKCEIVAGNASRKLYVVRYKSINRLLTHQRYDYEKNSLCLTNTNQNIKAVKTKTKPPLNDYVRNNRIY
jgi:hypothetical protein